MVKTLLFSFFILFQTVLFSQEVFKGNHSELDLYIKLRQIPPISVIDKAGQKFQLDKYVEANIRHAGKPFLLLVWGIGEATGAKSLGEIAESGIANEYNIISIFLDYKLDNADRMNKEVEKAAHGNKLDNILLVAANSKDAFAQFYLPYYPMHIFCNKYMRNIYPESLQPISSVKIMLDNLNGGFIQGDKLWHSKEGFITTETDTNAKFYTRFLFSYHFVRYINGTKDTVLTKIGYNVSGSDFPYERDFVMRTETGQLTAFGNFKEGIPIDTFKTWYEDGKVRSVYPVNGTYTFYDKKGELICDGPVLKGLGNGAFTQYTNGKPVGKSNYINGIRSGFQQQVAENGNLKEWFASSEYEFADYLKEGLQKIKKNNLFGFADKSGKIIIPIQFTNAADFKNGIANVSLSHDYFDIDKKGQRIKKEEVVVKPVKIEVQQKKYEQVFFSKDGYRKVKLNNKYGFINEEGVEITAIEYDDVWDFYEGMAAVKKDGKMGFINEKGKLVVAAKYLAADMFINGKARVAAGEYPTIKYGYIDKTGKEIIAVAFGYPRRSGVNYIIIKKDEKYGMLDWNGKTILPFIYESIDDFSQGLAKVEINGLYGYVDEKNIIIGTIKYAEAKDYKDGRAAVKILEGSLPLWGFVDLQGNMAVPFSKKLSRVESFENGYARVVDYENYKWGLIDKTGKNILPFKYSGISWNGYKEDIITAAINDKWGALDKENNIIVPFIYDAARDFDGGILWVQKNKKVGFVNKSGEVVIPIIYEAINDFEGELASVLINGAWKKINRKGEVKD